MPSRGTRRKAAKGASAAREELDGMAADLPRLRGSLEEGKKMAVKVAFMPQKSGLYIAVSPAAAEESRAKMQLLAGALVLKLFGFDKMFQGT